MKKILFSLIMIFSFSLTSFANQTLDNKFKNGVAQYKNGNYVGCLQTMEYVTKADPGNALAHYYLAMAYVKANKPDEAVKEYKIVISISPESRIASYARTGIKYIKPEEVPAEPVKAKVKAVDRDPYMSKEAKEFVTNQELKHVINQVNVKKDVDPAFLDKFEDYTPSAQNSKKKSSAEAPTQEEIANAMQVLSKAGMNSYNPQLMQMNMLMNSMNSNNNNGMNFNPMMMTMMQNGSQNMSPELMQQMYMNMMMPSMDFSNNEK